MEERGKFSIELEAIGHTFNSDNSSLIKLKILGNLLFLLIQDILLKDVVNAGSQINPTGIKVLFIVLPVLFITLLTSMQVLTYLKSAKSFLSRLLSTIQL